MTAFGNADAARTWITSRVPVPDARGASPAGWNVHPPGQASIDYGTAWVAAKGSAPMVAPSVVLSAADNVLVNRLDPGSIAIAATNTGRLGFDPRLVAP